MTWNASRCSIRFVVLFTNRPMNTMARAWGPPTEFRIVQGIIGNVEIRETKKGRTITYGRLLPSNWLLTGDMVCPYPIQRSEGVCN